MRNILIVGSGIAGITLAEILSNDKNNKIQIIDKRASGGGNCYDGFEGGAYKQFYGPHIIYINIRLKHL